MKNRTTQILFILFTTLILIWSQLFKTTTTHWLGDAELSSWFYSAGQTYIQHGSGTYGLPMYPGFTDAYTHLPSGPEWIQALIVLIKPAAIPLFSWNAFVTALFSIGLLCAAFSALRKITVALFPRAENLNEAITTVLLLALSSAGMQVFSGHPYLLGNLIADTLNLVLVAVWCANPEQNNWFKTVLGFSASLFVSFWMGLTPVTSSALWCLAAVYRFGAPEFRNRRIFQLVFFFGLTGLLCVALKTYENYLYLGSLAAVKKDMLEILTVREGISSISGTQQDYSFFKHLLKMGWRIPYLCGAIPFLILFFATQKSENLKKERFFFTAIFVAGISWQFAMRQHSFHHIYLARLTLLPLCLVLIGALVEKKNAALLHRIKFLSIFQVLLLWGVALIPAIR